MSAGRELSDLILTLLFLPAVLLRLTSGFYILSSCTKSFILPSTCPNALITNKINKFWDYRSIRPRDNSLISKKASKNLLNLHCIFFVIFRILC